MARVLVLRQRPEAEETALALSARGHVPLILPLQEVVPLADPPPQEAACGFVVTSRQAVPALAARFPGDPRCVLAVGPGTADALSAEGFADIRAGKGQALDLIEQAARLCEASGLPLIHVAGQVRMEGFEAGLAARGVALRVWEVYAMRNLLPSRVEMAGVLGAQAPEAVLLLSVGQAEGLGAAIARAPDLFAPMPRLLCLSSRICSGLAVELRRFATISPQPRLTALFDLCL